MDCVYNYCKNDDYLLQRKWSLGSKMSYFDLQTRPGFNKLGITIIQF